MPDWTDAKLAHVRAVGSRCLTWDVPVAIACSGGVDSTALLLLASSMRDQLAPFFVVHVDHRTRVESAEEGRHVAALCALLDVPFVAADVDADWRIGEHVAEHRLRAARYEALARVVRAHNLRAVVTAHTQDDQVETILMRLLSGTGSGGAAGMLPTSTIATASGDLQILRPLLDVSRSDLMRVVEDAGVEPILDPSNADTRYARNALRHEIIPQLRRLYPGFPATLLRSMMLVRDDAMVVNDLANGVFAEIVEATSRGALVDRNALRRASRPVASRIVRRVARQVSTAASDADWRELSSERIDAVLRAVQGRAGAKIELPHGVDVIIERDRVVFAQRGGRDDDDGRPTPG
ncbi:MAG: tRNA lysidine(34) synthetase TilS [Thermomicrobiales bacterium]|nr:tRNA lysidine(34) synthetase TilS [Thermomicrobiales bacterium]